MIVVYSSSSEFYCMSTVAFCKLSATYRRRHSGRGIIQTNEQHVNMPRFCFHNRGPVQMIHWLRWRVGPILFLFLLLWPVSRSNRQQVNVGGATFCFVASFIICCSRCLAKTSSSYGDIWFCEFCMLLIQSLKYWLLLVQEAQVLP